jgi:curved DNA-binding protein CbpA
MDNHYAVLNVAMDAPDAVVRAAYRVLAAQFHPDRHAADPAALQRMQQVTAAYRVLSDPRLRAEHDVQLQRHHRRRAGDVAAPHRVIDAALPVDGIADGERACLLATARRRAFVAAEYARHVALT